MLAFDQTKFGGQPNNIGVPVYVVDDQNKRIFEDIYVASVRVWNGGNNEIKPEDVRVPFKITFASDVRVLRLTAIPNRTDSGQDFSLAENNTLVWKHFDPSNGLTVQFTYAANKEAAIRLDGLAINSMKAMADTSSHNDGVGLYWVLVIGVISLAYVTLQAIWGGPRDRSLRIVLWLQLLFSLAGVVSVVSLLLRPSAPF